MGIVEPDFLTKLKWSLPWLSHYPLWLTRTTLRSFAENDATRHLIVVVANHFEPSWRADNSFCDLDTQKRRVESWVKQARAAGRDLQDHDRTRRALLEFRDLLAEEHNCLSREEGDRRPRYAFVHGNLALANSLGGRYCGVDNEMEILAETGCYADMTLPAAPGESQVAMINAIYQCGRPFNERAPHRTGRRLRVGDQVRPPIILTGPLIFDWGRPARVLSKPKLDDGALTAAYPPGAARLKRWRNARINVSGRPDWVFIKLYCHGFFTGDQKTILGYPMLKFWSDAIESADRSGQFKIHFATAREAFNIAMAAVDGRDGDPGLYRDYRLLPIRKKLRGRPEWDQ